MYMYVCVGPLQCMITQIEILSTLVLVHILCISFVQLYAVMPTM